MAQKPRATPPEGTFLVGDIVKVLPEPSINTRVHGAIGVVAELVLFTKSDGGSYIDDIRVTFSADLNPGNEEKYQNYFTRDEGIMVFPHELEKLEPQQTWEL